MVAPALWDNPCIAYSWWTLPMSVRQVGGEEKRWLSMLMFAISTRPGELADLTSEEADAMLAKFILSELGVEVNLKACSDSSFGVAIATKRIGPDKVRHLQIKQLWIQYEVQSGRLILQNLPGMSNPADLFTEALPKEIACRHVRLLRKIRMRSPMTSLPAELPSQ